MNTIKIAWLEDCTWCGCTELNVVTESGDENKLNLNDAVTCPECGAAGEIDCDDGCAFVAWAEPEPCQRCGVVSTRPHGEHYCHSNSQAAADNKLTDKQDHNLKIWPLHFAAVISGEKRAELRFNDRDYRVGDTLTLCEWDAVDKAFTGEFVSVNVTHIAELQEVRGYVLLSFELQEYRKAEAENLAVRELLKRAKQLMYQSGGAPIENSLNPIDAFLYDAEHIELQEYRSTAEFMPENLDRALTIMGVSLPESKEEFNLQAERWMQRLIDRVIRCESEWNAQQVVPSITKHFDDTALETAREVMCDVNRRHEFLGGEVQLLSRIQCRIDDALRAAMQSGAVKDGWVACSERMPPLKTGVIVGKWMGRSWATKWATYIPSHPEANSHGYIMPGGSWCPTHWQPLPAAPQQEA